jgi:hypothetical protein
MSTSNESARFPEQSRSGEGSSGRLDGNEKSPECQRDLSTRYQDPAHKLKAKDCPGPAHLSRAELNGRVSDADFDLHLIRDEMLIQQNFYTLL